MHAEEPYLTDDLSEEMKVARTTTISDLNRLRKAIEKYDLKIKGKPIQDWLFVAMSIRFACSS